MDELVAARDVKWPTRAAFIAENFQAYVEAGAEIAAVPFVDGSVLNSRPFRAAIRAIRGRPAYREVDRRVVYIDPNPTVTDGRNHAAMPGFFTTLRGALSQIPLSEPVTDELGWISRFNEQARRLQAIVESARPHVSRLVAEVTDGAREGPVTEARIREWRGEANTKAARGAGFAYEAYVRLKLAAVRGFVAKLIMDMRGIDPGSPFGRATAEIVDAWALLAGITSASADGRSLQAEAANSAQSMPRWVTFLLELDVDYRRRRLHFLIQGQNQLYQMLGAEDFAALDPVAVDRLKRQYYECVEALDSREALAARNPQTRELAAAIFAVPPSAAELADLGSYAREFATRHQERLDRLVTMISADIDMQASTHDIDVLLASTEGWPAPALHEVLVNYLGFPFFDVLTFPVMPWRQSGEFNEIRVDRISAQDAAGIAQLGDFPLKGAAFNQFAAFLSRAYRENDYLLGRLHAIDRLIDIVADAGGRDALTPDAVAALKRKAILRVLDAEQAHLPTCAGLIAQLRQGLKAA